MALTINLKGDTGEELDGLMPHIAAMSAGHAVPAPHAPMAPIAPPEAGGAPPPIQPMSSITGPTDPNLRMPTKQESHEAGKAEYERGMPSITAQPLTPEHAQQDYAQREYKAQHPWGSDVSEHPGVWGKIGHGLAEVGNIAGNTLVPGLTANIPGSELNNRLHERSDRQQFNEGEKNRLESAEAWGKLNAPEAAQKLEQEKESDREKLAASNQVAAEQRESERGEAAEKRTQEEIASHEKIAENKPEKPSEIDKDIKDYLASRGLEDTPANREKARESRATRDRPPRTPTDREEWQKDHPNEPIENYWTAKAGAGGAAKALAAEEAGRAAQAYADDYLKSGRFTGAGDEALMEKYFELAKPSSGFRMTQPQIEMLTKAQNMMNSVVARGKHLFSPEAPYFSNDLRNQIVETMRNLQTSRDEAKPKAAGGGAPAGGKKGDPLGLF